MPSPIRPQRFLLISLALSLLLAGCASPPIATAEPPTPEQTDPLAIAAGPGLQPVLTTLYQAFSGGETPSFIYPGLRGADISADRAPEATSPHPEPTTTFLPGFTLTALTESQKAADFIAFAISPEGQAVLIEAGNLPETITVTDQAGQTLTIAQPVRRVISAYGMATAVVYTVDAEGRLVSASYLGARDPQGAAAMVAMDPRFEEINRSDVFSQQNFNAETAAALEPDLILAGARSNWLDTAAELGIPTIQIDAETPERLKEAVLLIGEIFGPHTQARAQAWATYYTITRDALESQTGNIPAGERPVVLFTGTEPLRVASGDMVQTSLIAIAGGHSASANLSGYWNNVNLEQIALWEPDVIIVPSYGGASVEAITQNPEWQILDAVSAGRVYQMPKLVAPWDTPAPASVLGMVWLAERLFPERTSRTCAEEAAYFYRAFYDYELPADTLESLCTVPGDA
jgi:iron complex transport system substrate-binding protein